jgi:hypothetical protein
MVDGRDYRIAQEHVAQQLCTVHQNNDPHHHNHRHFRSSMRFVSHISTESHEMDVAAEEILAIVAELRQESETWRAVAEKYKQAFEQQTIHLQELQDICVATQAELENERTEHRRRNGARSASLRRGSSSSTTDLTFGTASMISPSLADPAWQQTTTSTSPCFRRVEQFASQRDYGTALKEVDHLLHGPLTPATRVEGLLVKSNLMRKSEWLFDALATCSEALELCNRLEELHCFLPRLQYQRGLCYYQLNMVQEARDALGSVSTVDGLLHFKARALRTSCEERLHADRRAGFEAHRSLVHGSLSPTTDYRFDVSQITPLLCLWFLTGRCSLSDVARAHSSNSTFRRRSAFLSLSIGLQGPNRAVTVRRGVLIDGSCGW